MNNIKKISTVLLICLLTSSCMDYTMPPVEENFPLHQQWVFKSGTIFHLFMGGDWLAVDTSKGFTAIDLKTGEVLWKQKNLLSVDASGRIKDNELFVSDSEKIVIFDKAGNQKRNFDLLPSIQKGAEIVSISDQVIIVLRPDWLLDAYRHSTGDHLWVTNIPRGGGEVYIDEDANLFYILSDDIQIHNLNDGTLIREIPGWFLVSDRYANMLYTSKKDKNSGAISIEAFDLENSFSKMWSNPISSKANSLVYQDSRLLLGMENGVLAIDAIKGKLLWHVLEDEEVIAPPLKIGEFVFVKGRQTKKIFAFSSEDGKYIGYLQIEKPREIFESKKSSTSQIYSSGDWLIVPNDNTIYAYK